MRDTMLRSGMSSDRIILHVGAHRTGTTSLQTALDEASEVLARSGVIVLTPPRPGKRDVSSIRDAIRRAPKPRHSRRRLKTWLATQLARRDYRLVTQAHDKALRQREQQIILSDEMILGPAFDSKGRAFYPEAAPRLHFFQRAFLHNVAEVHLTVRSYETFLVSCYAMRAVYAGKIPAFDDLRASLVNFETGWPALVQTLRAYFPEASLTLSVFEETTVANRLRAMLPREMRTLVEVQARFSNRAPTTEAIAFARKLAERTPNPDGAVEDFVGGSVFDPLTDEEKAALNTRYLTDLDSMRKLPHARFLEDGAIQLS